MAAKKDIEIRQNADFRLESQWIDEDGGAKDLSGCLVKMQIRDRQGGETIYGTWTNGDGFTIDGLNGTITLEIPQTDVANWTFKKAEYDIVVTWPGTLKKDIFLYGDVSLKKGVTY